MPYARSDRLTKGTDHLQKRLYQLSCSSWTQERWKIGATSHGIDTVDGEQNDMASGGIGGTTRVSGKHVGRHAGGEVVDDHLEFCKARRRLGSNGRKDIEHATRVNDQLRNHTGDRLDLLSTEGLRGFQSIPCLRTRARQT